ncbi:MAG: ribosomal-processing cysteine protease Prp [Treponema sp.]|jgi:uncharacterized protein YsxB (DUF464 family)|nr:ribosomal-processing cysteine protease Prp [Treponema sp.]
MIMIDVVLDSAEILTSCRVSGHAHAGLKGGDVVCAAVSILTRTALQILSLAEGIVVRGGPFERGVFLMEIEYTAAGKDTLFVAGAFLIEGLHSVSEEYPDYCTMTIRRN